MTIHTKKEYKVGDTIEIDGFEYAVEIVVKKEKHNEVTTSDTGKMVDGYIPPEELEMQEEGDII